MMFPVIWLEGKPYLDGGCADPIPWKHALEQGCDRVVVVLTRERDYRKQADGTLRVLDRVFRQYPRFLATMHARAEAYNRGREELFALEKAGRILVIAPEDTLGCRRTERDLEVIRALWQSGYFTGRNRAEEIRAFWQGETESEGEPDVV